VTEIETATGIRRRLTREWGELALIDPKGFVRAVWDEVLQIDEHGKRHRSLNVRGTFGAQVGENEMWPISCCDAPYLVNFAGRGVLMFGRTKHEPDCITRGLGPGALALASGGAVTFPPGRGEEAA
jgi:hypothetical protein